MYFLEYSKSQNSHHICEEDDRLMNEVSCIERGHDSDWVVIKTFANLDDALGYLEKTRKEL